MERGIYLIRDLSRDLQVVNPEPWPVRFPCQGISCIDGKIGLGRLKP